MSVPHRLEIIMKWMGRKIIESIFRHYATWLAWADGLFSLFYVCACVYVYKYMYTYIYMHTRNWGKLAQKITRATAQQEYRFPCCWSTPFPIIYMDLRWWGLNCIRFRAVIFKIILQSLCATFHFKVGITSGYPEAGVEFIH